MAVVQRVIAVIAWVPLLVILSGCGGPSRPKTAPVTGTVTYKNSPVEGAAVMFAQEKGAPATGQTDAQGKFVLTTFEPKDGAIPGNFTVTVTKMESAPASQGDPGREGPKPNAPKPKSLIPVKYSDPKATDLKATVAADKPNDFTFDLKD